MRCVLTIPPELDLHVDALAPLADDLDAWIAGTLARELPAGARVLPGNLLETATATGWPLKWVGARVVRGDDVIELRVAGFFRFFEHGAAALARVAPGPGAEATLAAALAAFATAEPDFGGAIATVRELWEDAP